MFKSLAVLLCAAGLLFVGLRWYYDREPTVADAPVPQAGEANEEPPPARPATLPPAPVEPQPGGLTMTYSHGTVASDYRFVALTATAPPRAGLPGEGIRTVYLAVRRGSQAEPRAVRSTTGWQLAGYADLHPDPSVGAYLIDSEGQARPTALDGDRLHAWLQYWYRFDRAVPADDPYFHDVILPQVEPWLPLGDEEVVDRP